MRSSRGRPDAWYFLAIDTTNRRFDWTNWRSASSPWRAVRRSSRFLAGGEFLAGRIEFGEGLVAGFDRLRQSHLVVFGQQRVLPDVREVETYEVFVVSIDAIFGHRRLPTLGRRQPDRILIG